MKNIWNWVKGNPNRTMFLIPILLVAGISISHVVSWYNIANPLNWAIYLSIAIEVGAMTALVAATNKIKGGVWFMFGLVTLIQMIGNIFYSFKEIDENGDLFKSWVELTGPFWDMFTDSADIISMKRWLAFLEGGLLPIISLTSLHFFVKYEKPEEKKEGVEHKVWEKVKELKKEGKLPEITEEDKEDEPTALANSQYRNEITLFDNVLEDDGDSEELIEEHDILDNQIHLVEENVPEEELIEGSVENTENTSEEQSNVVFKNKNGTLGDELNRTWLNIIKNKRNNGIDRI